MKRIATLIKDLADTGVHMHSANRFLVSKMVCIGWSDASIYEYFYQKYISK